MRSRLVCAAVLASAALLVTPLAHGEEPGDVALDQLDPAPAGDAFYSIPSPFIGGHLVPRVLALVDHAAKPLVLETASSSEAVVGRQTFLHIDVSLALWERLQADILLPIALTQGGEAPDARGGALPSLKSPVLGDLRLGLRVRLVGGDDDRFQLGAGATLRVPTAASGAFVGDGGVRDTPYISLGGRMSFLVWSAAVGAAIRGSNNPSTLTYGGGTAVLVAGGLAQVGLEIFAATPLQDDRIDVSEARSIPRERLTNAEALLSARVHLPAGFVVGAGVGLGLSEAIGTPAFRVLGGVGWELSARPANTAARDTDADGIADEEDACPSAFGPKDADSKRSGCPSAEEDGDPRAGGDPRAP
jgi:OmpA-OmpF porin, OOP family